MDEVLALEEDYDLSDGLRAELVAWELPTPARGSGHRFKYRFAFIVQGECVLRYDNEAGKGDHRHLGNREFAHDFVDLATLEADFWSDVQRWKEQR